MAHEGVPLVAIQRQLGHANLGITSVYLAGRRQQRDHQHRPRTAMADDLRHRWSPDDSLDEPRPGRPGARCRPDPAPTRVWRISGRDGVTGLGPALVVAR